MSEIDEIQKRAKEFLDKRRFERFKAGLQVRFRVIGAGEKQTLLGSSGYTAPGAFMAKAAELKDLKQVLSEDISLGGLRLATPLALPLGVDLWINLGLPEIPIPMNAIATVMWSRPHPSGGYQNGLQFTAINQADLATVESFVAHQKKKE